MNIATSSDPAWWRWPTVLSLDAPIVTVSWQWLMAHVSVTPLAWYHYAIVGLSVWLAYAADRSFESWRTPVAQLQTARHRFYHRHRRTMSIIWLLTLAGALWLSLTHLSSRELAAGGLLLAPVLAYLLSHQLVHRGHPWRAPKEVCVAGLLGAGAALFPATAGAWSGELLEGLGWFVALAFVNCALIGRWEHVVDHVQGQDSLVQWYPRCRRIVPLLPWLLLAVAGGCWIAGAGAMRPPRACALLSAGLLGSIDRLERYTGWPLARLLADAALLTPAAWLAVIWLSP